MADTTGSCGFGLRSCHVGDRDANTPGAEEHVVATRDGFVATTPLRPVVKWVGGKRRLLEHLLPRVPETRGRYYEPFVGGGALFFALRPSEAHINDLNHDLVNLYRVIRDTPESLIDAMASYVNDKDCYLAVRAIDPAALSPVDQAARFLYLNRTCYNGLYRVNKAGRFNVPFGRYKRPSMVDPENLRRVSALLQQTEITALDFEEACAGAGAGDFVYFDPPYAPVSETAYFTQYTGGGFTLQDQERLATLFRRLDRKGVRLMLSNSDTPFVRALYAGFSIETVPAPRAINCRGDRRGPVSEVIVTNTKYEEDGGRNQ